MTQALGVETDPFAPVFGEGQTDGGAFQFAAFRIACAELIFARLSDRPGVALLVGPKGSGKSVLMGALLADPGTGDKPLLVDITPSYSVEDFLSYCQESFGDLSSAATSFDRAPGPAATREPGGQDQGSDGTAPKASLPSLADLTNYLVRRGQANGPVTLLIDRAANLRPDLLEILLQLGGRTKNGRRLVHVVFAVDDQDQAFVEKLAAQTAFRCDLGPMTEEDVAEYIDHRLTAVGSRESGLFSQSAIGAIAEETGGRPGKVAALCRQALAIWSAEDKNSRGLVTLRHVVQAVVDTSGEEEGTGKTEAPDGVERADQIADQIAGTVDVVAAPAAEEKHTEAPIHQAPAHQTSAQAATQFPEHLVPEGVFAPSDSAADRQTAQHGEKPSVAGQANIGASPVQNETAPSTGAKPAGSQPAGSQPAGSPVALQARLSGSWEWDQSSGITIRKKTRKQGAEKGQSTPPDGVSAEVEEEVTLYDETIARLEVRRLLSSQSATRRALSEADLFTGDQRQAEGAGGAEPPKDPVARWDQAHGRTPQGGAAVGSDGQGGEDPAYPGVLHQRDLPQRDLHLAQGLPEIPNRAGRLWIPLGLAACLVIAVGVGGWFIWPHMSARTLSANIETFVASVEETVDDALGLDESETPVTAQAEPAPSPDSRPAEARPESVAAVPAETEPAPAPSTASSTAATSDPVQVVAPAVTAENTVPPDAETFQVPPPPRETDETTLVPPAQTTAAQSTAAQETADPVPANQTTPNQTTANQTTAVDLVARGDLYLALKNLGAARTAYQEAVAFGSATAQTAMGKTYDPLELEARGLSLELGNAKLARSWYERGLEAGDGHAQTLLDALDALGPTDKLSP